MPMSLRRVANILNTDAILFQEFCDRFTKYGDKTVTLFADRGGGRDAGVFLSASGILSGNAEGQGGLP